MKRLGIVFWISILGAVLLVANVAYFSGGLHRTLTWAFCVADATYLAVGLFIWWALLRKRSPVDMGREIDPH